MKPVTKAQNPTAMPAIRAMAARSATEVQDGPDDSLSRSLMSFSAIRSSDSELLQKLRCA
jgi:hypothetical protein